MSVAVLVPALLAALAVTAVMRPPPRLAPCPRPGSRRRADEAGTLPGQDLGPGRVPEQAGTPGRLATGTASVAAGTGVALLVGSGVGVALGLATVPIAWRWFARLEPASARRRREELEGDLPLLVDLLVACLRAGQAPGSALAAVAASLEPGALRTEVGTVVARLRLGGDPLSAWRALGSHPQLGAVGRTVARALDGGASVADAMADLAQELRRARRADVQARARAVGARAAAPLGLCLLPAFVLVGIVPVVAGSLGALLQR